MAIQRKIVGEPVSYRGRTITVRFMGPDLLCEVNGMELQGFFLDAPAARAAGERHVDAEIKAEEEARAEAAKTSRRA